MAEWSNDFAIITIELLMILQLLQQGKLEIWKLLIIGHLSHLFHLFKIALQK